MEQYEYEREVGDWTIAVECVANSPFAGGCRVVVLGCSGAPRSMCLQDTIAHAVEYANAVTRRELERFTAP